MANLHEIHIKRRRRKEKRGFQRRFWIKRNATVRASLNRRIAFVFKYWNKNFLYRATMKSMMKPDVRGPGAVGSDADGLKILRGGQTMSKSESL